MAQALDPVTLEILRNTLPAVANEMALDLKRTSYNMMIYEVCDFCTALLDKKGRLMAQNVGGVSHFVADLGAIIEDAVARYGTEGFKPGDVVITNHQRVAGQHLNNIVIYVPFIYKGELIAFCVTRAHWIDVGGMSTGFGAGPMVTDPWMEGLQLDQLKIYEDGKLNDTLYRIISDNIRYPESSLGDMRAQIASCRNAARRLEELCDKYSPETLLSAVEAIFDESEARCCKAIGRIANGVYEAESFYDDDTVRTGEPVRIHAKVTVNDGAMTIDLSGCSQKREGGINARTLAGARVAYKALTEPQAAVNEGGFRALTTIIPEGNIMMAPHPAPMGMWSLVLPTVVDTILKALAPALPKELPAAHHGLLGGSVAFFGERPKGGRFVVQSLEGGGWGGNAERDGESGAVSICQGDVKNAPIESIELKNPVIVEERSLRPDSGGPGRNRGGLGVRMRVRNLVEGRWNLNRSRRRGCPPWGLEGGKSPATGEYLLRLPQENDFTSVDSVMRKIPAGAEVCVLTGGGGGWGPPDEREPERVLQDVLDGFVSAEAARRDYGVVIDTATMTINQQETQSLRASRARQAAE
jgi:N-methylhydantoinase B